MTAPLTIQAADVRAAQAAWGDGVIWIGEAPTWEEAHARASRFVQERYFIEGGSLLFCPTMAADTQFRSTLPDAVSYFVGRSEEHPEDQGFALQSWTGIRFENHGVVCRGGVAWAMGNYFFKRADNTGLKVEFSFVFVPDESGHLRIQLHHSALPFDP